MPAPSTMNKQRNSRSRPGKGARHPDTSRAEGVRPAEPRPGRNAQRVPLRLGWLAALAITAMLVIPLIAFGLSYPQQRVRGDASEYLVIAQQFDGLWSILGYAGNRTAGLPIFEYAVRMVLGLFTSNAGRMVWVDAICLALFVLHVATAWIFSLWARRTNLIASEGGVFFLFLFLATYPAFVGHTTAPLSDTLAVDLVLCAVVAMEASFRVAGLARACLLAGTAGLLFGFSNHVRPGSLMGIALALAAGGAISFFRGWRVTTAIGAAMLGCAAMLAPFASACTQKYGTLCLQSPQTVSIAASAQAGLRGARIVWSKGALVPGELPILPDELMFNDFYRRCHLESIVGIGESSWTGCLLSRPLSMPAFLVKKWIGLFDHFQFTPYLEVQTPPWLRWWSRAYDMLAWVGLALVFWSLVQASTQRNRAHVGTWLRDHITPVQLAVYSMAMLAVHTVLHIEDRYGLPVVPLCAVLLVVHGERSIRQCRASGWRSIAPIAAYCILAGVLFVAQIIAWDNATFH